MEGNLCRRPVLGVSPEGDVISGSITFVIEGMDEKLTFNAGDTYLLPSKILHNETWVSDDFQVLEIYAPANAGTRQLTPEVE